mmetsp:Transcript_28727/g.46208  ORF Transcript_28727/g.46208 Transcript_28727/m.46208 type:complete len:289 (+) Transcript_28727:135-1001(+)
MSSKRAGPQAATASEMAQDELDRRLLFEVERGDVAAVALLLAAGACAEARDMSRSAAGESALHTASLGGRDVIAAMLLDARACVDSVDGFGDTALICAASQGHARVVQLLVGAGADANGVTTGSSLMAQSSLHLACKYAHAPVVRLLLDASAAPLAPDAQGYTALHWAASSGDTEIVQLLLSARCNINATSTDGNTPLHSAALGNNVEITQALIQQKGDVNATNDLLHTPLHIAAMAARGETVQLLLRNGAFSCHKTGDGRTAHDLALEWGGHDSSVALLLAITHPHA